MNKAKIKSVFLAYIVWVIVILEFLAFACLSNSFLTIRNILTVLRQVAVTTVMAFGAAYVLISGNIDLSCGAVVSITGVIAAKAYSQLGCSIPICIILAILTGTFIGLVNGLIIIKTKMPALIGTLGMSQVVSGTALLITKGVPVYDIGESWKVISQSYLFGVPLPIYYMVVLLIIAWFVLSKTYFGRYLFAVGSNAEAARLTGINTGLVRVVSYVISGFASAIAGVMLMSRVNSGQPSAGNGLEMDVLTALVVGGVSVAGGKGRLINVLAGSLVIGVLNNGLVNIGVTEFWQQVIKGTVLLLAVGFDSYQNSKKSAA